ncbi:PREDICTED: GPN-loop GTPase 3-like [Amphimedon queenslandica]|uniref:GPN-loop GTPase 3 n=1 Tax=Amphimedon queenslandica TaxID=400682 RepID=A0AAN0JNY6_AMPQE|nr:PREDICTED: GPN-loop GTPase 3-like [Amphimedon queenslandica]|eukprot:XP_019858729.1 PREDICTED: GPN-loop GTPase 3-like [Amphimedon queenslandica]
MRYGQVVMGPAGCGKSTYCSNVVAHCADVKRTVHVVNLDPAAEAFNYPVTVDIRELIQVDDVMSDDSLKLGPNGGLIFCMEYLVQNLSWLEEQLEDGEDDYFLFDCPGQIELYTHVPVMSQIVEQLDKWGFRLCGVFLLDSAFLTSTTKFISGVMTTLSSMVTLKLPQINVLSKIDLLTLQSREDLERYLDPQTSDLLQELSQATHGKFKKLNKAICSLVS